MSTKHIPLSKDWVLIGRGPALVDALKAAHIHCGEAAPLASTKAFHKVGSGRTHHLQVDKPLKIWARSNTMFGSSVIMTGEGA